MQRLCPAEDGGQRLNRGADDVVLGLLGGERGPSGLSVEAQHPGMRIPCLETLAHDVRPHAAGGTELGYFFQKIIVRVKEKGNAGGEFVHV